MTKIRSLLLVFMFACSFIASAASETVHERWTRDSKFHLFSVVFAITLDANSKIDQFRVAKVIDPGAGTTEPVDITVSKKYVDAARKKLSARKYQPSVKDGKPEEFFTYLYYSPEYSTTVISDLQKPLNKQP